MKRPLYCLLILFLLSTTIVTGKAENYSSKLSQCLFNCKTSINQGNLQKIRSFSTEAIHLYSLAKPVDINLLFSYYSQLGNCYALLGEKEKALEFFRLSESCLKYNSERINSLDIAEMYFNRGYLLASIYNFPAAIQNYIPAIKALKHSKNHNQKTEIYYKACLAHAYWSNCELDKAAKIADSCQSFLLSYGNPEDPELLDSYMIMTEYLFISESPFQLINRNIHFASEIIKKHFPSNHYKTGILLYLKGHYYYSKISVNKAIHYLNQASDILSGYPSLKNILHLNNKIKAYGLYVMRDKNTIPFCFETIQKNEISHKNSEFFYLMIGRENLIRKNYPEAVKYLNLAIRTAKQHKNSESVTIAVLAYVNLAEITYVSQPDRSLEFLFKGLKVAETVFSRSSDISSINLTISRMYYAKKDYKRSLFYNQQALIASSVSFNDTSVFSNPLITDLKRYFNIECLLLKANNLYKLYGEINSRQAYVEAALASNECAARILEKRIIDVDDEDAGLYTIEYAKRTMSNLVYFALRLYELTGKKVYGEKSLNYAEKSKMQILYIKTSKNEKLRNAGIPDSLIAKNEKIQNKILDLENQPGLKNGLSYTSENKQIQQLLTQLYDEHDDLMFYLNEHYPLLGKSQYDVKMAGIQQIRKMLEPDQAIVEYQFLIHENIIFVITKDTFSIQRRSADNGIREQIQLLRKSLTTLPVKEDFNKMYNDFTSSSKYVYNELIAPVYGQIKGKRLIIIPHNELTLIPFEVLISDIPSKKHDFRNLPYLVREFPVVYAYSANFLLDQGRNKKYGNGTAIFLPDYHSWGMKNGADVFEPLNGAESEASNIRRISGGRIFSGSRATESTFKKKAHLYRVLHIASHTLLNEDNPNLSSLVFTHANDSADDGFLYSFELRQMKLNAQLVVLSGCNTGYGNLRISEGLVSLARSLFYTNVRTVAFTLWPVADKSGSSLISNFYKGLKDKEYLDISMRKAKLDFLEKADPVQTHPYYWANFMIVGKTENVPVHKSCLIRILLISLTIAITIFWILKKNKRLKILKNL